MSPARDPYRRVKRILRQEVGFCCPVAGCGNPYLTWHHFDPPWRVEQHHRPEGMIALCGEHAAKADNGAFTDDQLRELKRVGRTRAVEARGQFNWMRDKILGVIGGNYFYETPIVLTVGNVPCIWWNRDDDGNLLFNLRVPGFADSRRPRIDGNWWSVLPDDVAELEAPPNGRKIRLKYPNGDEVAVEFSSMDTLDELLGRWPDLPREWANNFEFPLTVMQVYERIVSADIELSSYGTRLGGQVQAVMEGNLHLNVSVAAIGIGDDTAAFGLAVPPQVLNDLLHGFESEDPRGS